MAESTTATTTDPNTGAGLIEFLDAAIEKGWLNVGSAKALRTATKKIFEVEPGWASMDLRSLDADSLYERFCNLKRNDYSDDSMRIYRTRFKQALQMHLARIDGDSNWKSLGPGRATGGPQKPAANGGKAGAKAGAKAGNRNAPKSSGSGTAAAPPGDPDEPPADVAPHNAVPLIRFPFPLRDAVDVWLTLPRDLTKSEAERLCVFIGSLARNDAGGVASSSAGA